MITCTNLLLVANIFIIIYLVFGDFFRMKLMTCFWLPFSLLLGLIILLDKYVLHQAVAGWLESFLFVGRIGETWNPFMIGIIYSTIAASFAFLSYFLSKKRFVYVPYSQQDTVQKVGSILTFFLTKAILLVCINYFFIILLTMFKDPFGIGEGFLPFLFK